MAISKLERAIALLREAFAEEYERGGSEAIARLVSAAGSPAPVQRAAAKKKRAPKGAARTFVGDMLKAHPGLNFAGLLAWQKTPELKAISASAIRKELDRGRGTGEYVSEKGRYSLSNK